MSREKRRTKLDWRTRAVVPTYEIQPTHTYQAVLHGELVSIRVFAPFNTFSGYYGQSQWTIKPKTYLGMGGMVSKPNID